mmetsp:Transcript_107024/g.312979  ORF Transcript_107024/g.312979 Transcript_107024/m.312979 type:complete len:218 (+) Transcript_107024:1-654(+)
MRYRRHQQRILEKNGSPASVKTYLRRCHNEQLPKHAAPPSEPDLPAKLERLRRLMELLLAESALGRKRKAPENEVLREAQVHPAGSDAATVLKRQILGYISTPLPLCDRLERLTQQESAGVLSAGERREAVRREIRAASCTYGPHALTVPLWFQQWCRTLGERQVSELWASAVQHPRVQRAVEEAFAEVRANKNSFAPLLDLPSRARLRHTRTAAGT